MFYDKTNNSSFGTVSQNIWVFDDICKVTSFEGILPAAEKWVAGVTIYVLVKG
jgi:hypothetical protein